MIFNKDFVNEITFWLRHRKKYDEKNACVQLGNSNWRNIFVKSKDIKGNFRILKYQNIKIANNSSIKWGSWTCVVTYWFEKIMDVSTFVLYFQFEIYWGSWFKFLIRNFTVVLIRNFFRDWEPEFLKQPHRYFSGNWRNWWKNKSALGIKYLHRKRKRKTNHTLVKPSSRFSFHKPSPCQV